MDNKDTKKQNKRQLKKVLILVMALVVLAFSGTYAYFTTNFVGGPTTTTVKSGVFKVESSLDTASVIRNRRMVLIHVNDTQDQRDEKADKLVFTVTSKPESTVDGEFYLYLKDIKLTKNLYTNYLKWELLKGNEIISHGDFQNAVRTDAPVDGEAKKAVTDVEEITLTTNSLPILKNTTETYTFRMYLVDDPNKNQIDLTEGSFSGRLYLEAVPVSAVNTTP